MTEQPDTKYIRVILFDDEPQLLVGALERIRKDLAGQNVEVEIHTYRVDWYFQAEQEVKMNRYMQISTLWLIDLQQRYKIDSILQDKAKSALINLGLKYDKIIKDLQEAAAKSPLWESRDDDQDMTLDGAAIIAFAREEAIPFLIASVYADDPSTRNLIAELAAGDFRAPSDKWDMQKNEILTEATRGGPAQTRLKEMIANLAKPLESKAQGKVQQAKQELARGVSSSEEQQEINIIQGKISVLEDEIIKQKQFFEHRDDLFLQVETESQSKLYLNIVMTITIAAIALLATYITGDVSKYWDGIEPISWIWGFCLYLFLGLLGINLEPFHLRSYLKGRIFKELYQRKVEALTEISEALVMNSTQAIEGNLIGLKDRSTQISGINLPDDR